MKTRVLDFEQELTRINKLRDFRKLFADTQVMTTLFLKRCIKVPKIGKCSVENPNGLTAQ